MVEKVFKGGGGGGGGGGNFTNTPDNLRSTDTFEGLMGMCVGPIKGPVGGLKGIIMDGTPIIDETDQENFPEFLASYSDGDPTQFPQLVTMRLGSAAAPQSVSVAISNTNTAAGTGSPGPFTSRTLANVAPNYLDLRFIVQQLFRQDEGGIWTTKATLEIQMKPSGTTNWINPTVNDGTAWTGGQGSKSSGGIHGLITAHLVDQSHGTGANNFVIDGKTSSPTVAEVRIWVPTEGNYLNKTWDVRVRLLEREAYSNDQDVEQRQIIWESIAAIYDETIGEEEDWRGLSWLQLYGKATDNLKGVPEVEVIADTKIMSVPPTAVWNSETRVFTGALWDGSWAKGFTTDPAWIINDALSDPLSGLYRFAPGTHLNKWDALEASKWFSELVPDGAGGYHPRYSLNVVHNQPMKAEDFIRYLAGAVGGMAWDQGDGEWRLKVDKPETPVDIFTVENIEGEFTYSHTDVDTRFNDYRGSFLNEEFDFREETIGVVDNTSIALIGHKPTTIALIGCTNRQEALRRLMVRLRSSTRETKIVNFTTNRRADHLIPLETILVADSDLGDQAARTTGRVTSIDNSRTVITVRDPLRLEIGVNYTLKFAKPNVDYDPDTLDQPSSTVWTLPTVVDQRTVMNTAGQRGNVTTLYLDTELPTDTAEYLVVALEATGLATLPKQYRIISLSREDENTNERVTVAAVEVDSGKWAAADGVTSQDSVFVDLTTVAPAPLPPISGNMVNIVTTPSLQGYNHSIIGNFTRPLGAQIDGFRVTYSINGGAEQILHERLLVPTFDLVNPTYGEYLFKVYTRTRTGVFSLPLTQTITVDQTTLDAADLRYVDGQTIESLQPSQAGADPTGSNIAAGITGQGDLATEDVVTWPTQVTGNDLPTQTGVGSNMLLDDTFLSTQWTFNPNSVRAARNSTNGFAQGFAPYHLDWTVATTNTTWTHNSLRRPNVTIGKRYYASVGIQKNSSVLSATSIMLAIAFWNAAGTLISSSDAVTLTAAELTAGAVPKQYQVSGVAPALAVTASVVCYVAPIASAAGHVRFELPVLSEVGQTAIVQGTTAKVVKYDNTITPLSGELPAPLNYSLSVNGVGQTAGVTWTYTVLTGTLNGFTIDDGPKSVSGSGGGTFTINTVETDAATVRITAVQAGITSSLVLAVSRDIAPSTSGGGGGAWSVVGSVTGTTASGTFADKSGSITGTMPAGKTTANVLAGLSNNINPINASQTETVEFKLERNISGTWTQIGSTVSCQAKERLVDVETQQWAVTQGAVTLNINDTGLTAGNTYSWRISARRSSGSHTNYLSGPVTVTAP